MMGPAAADYPVLMGRTPVRAHDRSFGAVAPPRTASWGSGFRSSRRIVRNSLAGVLLTTFAFASSPRTCTTRRRATKAPSRPKRAKGFGAKAPAPAAATEKKPEKVPFKGARDGGPSEDTEMPVVHALKKHGPAMIKGLRERGWWASEAPVFLTGLRKVLRKEVEALWQEGYFQKSQSVRAGGEYYDKQNVYATEIGSDKYDTAPRLVHYTVRVAKEFTRMVKEAFPDVQISQSIIGNKLNLCVGNGASFDAHLDVGVQEKPFNRRLTLLLYLNAWKPDHGGELTLFGEGSTEAEAAARRGDRTDVPVKLEPWSGRWVVFWSDKMLHRVEPAFSPGGPADHRISYTVWFCTEDDGSDSTPKVAEVVPDAGYEQAPSFSQF